MNEQQTQEEWTTRTTKSRRRGGRNNCNRRSNTTKTIGLSAVMNNMTLNGTEGDVSVSSKEVEASLRQCQGELLQSDFYQSLIAYCDDRPYILVEDVVCYGIGNFYAKRPTAPLWQLALAVMLREYYSERLQMSRDPGNDTAVISMNYFEPRMTAKERDFLQNTLQVHVIDQNERGFRTISEQKHTLFFMPHCPMALYANLSYSNWECLDKLIIFGNSLSNYLDGHQSTYKAASGSHPSDKKRCCPNPSVLNSKKLNNHESSSNSNSQHNQKLSRALSWALRHNAQTIGLTIREDGYVPVQEILDCRHSKIANTKPTLEAIQEVVNGNDKQRFKLDYQPRHLFYPCEKEDSTTNANDNDNNMILCIRANQGHSMSFINPDLLLRQLSPDELRSLPCIVHGTYVDAWNAIQKQGLSKMNRTHIHFAAGLPDHAHVISGMRKSATVYIYVDAAKCADDGITFYQSDNGVLLSEGIDGMLPTMYFSRVIEAATGQLLWGDHGAAEQVTSVHRAEPVPEETKQNDDPASTKEDEEDDMLPTATALEILSLLQPCWKETTIAIGKKDLANRSAHFEQAFNDSSLTTFVSLAGQPRPQKIEDDKNNGEVV
ncbi:phosphotransferase KptA/Tpt1 domain containing protein [Nitzschia inconspicua]|uniref:Phosphotransferase KptA/Tpt1 domain containing protein n=1 Tax=Nitzschia inconspicua TaxID=303405 RepID=A0A9K3PT66_9STRA|nr:phosphotransferase KptA/Tpt1 domain containing protein [Nitzschia inconspicua]